MYIGEWHEDKLHGIAKHEWNYNKFKSDYSSSESDETRTNSEQGQYKNDKKEGYITYEKGDGTGGFFQYKNGDINGYGIQTWKIGEYCGEFKNGLKDGYGLMKWRNKDEYDGQYKKGRKEGEGQFTKASTGRVERGLYIQD